MVRKHLPKPEAGIQLVTFPERAGAMVFASKACAKAFGSDPRRFAAWIRQHVEQFGPSHEDEVPAGSRVKLTYQTVELVVMFVRMDLADGGLPITAIAAVLPEEVEVGERSLAALRSQVEKLAGQPPRSGR